MILINFNDNDLINGYKSFNQSVEACFSFRIRTNYISLKTLTSAKSR